MYMNYMIGYKWWHLPTIATASAVSIMICIYLISVSQFGTNIAFMFNNLI